MSGKKDQRSKTRSEVNIKVDYEWMDISRTAASIRNLSTEGAFVTTQAPLPEGTLIRLHFNIPELNQAIVLEGEVRWRCQEPKPEENQEAGMGIKFSEIDAEQESAIEKLINSISNYQQSQAN